MKKKPMSFHFTKLLATLLTAVLLFSSLCITSFAASKIVLEDGSALPLRIKL